MFLIFALLSVHLHFTEGKLQANVAEELYTKLFKQTRVQQLEAVKSLHKLASYEQQHNMIMLMTEKIFSTIQHSRAQLESSGFIPGVSPFPSDDQTKDALSNILENTALFSEMTLRLPDVTTAILKTNNNWNMLLQWSIAFAHQVKYLLDGSTVTLLHLVSQELNHTEREPMFVNPYRKRKAAEREERDSMLAVRKKKRKELKKGPRLYNEL